MTHSPTRDPVDVLVVAAHPEELCALESQLRELDPRERRGAGSLEQARSMEARIAGPTVRALPTGVGLAAASTGTALAIERMQPRVMILVGSCGAYPTTAGLRVGDLVQAERVLLADLAVARGEAALVAATDQVLGTDSALRKTLGEHGASRSVWVANTLGITTSDSAAQLLGATTGCAVENLEAFGVALAAAAASIPCAVVLGGTNVVRSEARPQWRQHREQAAFKTARLVCTWLEHGARKWLDAGPGAVSQQHRSG